MTIGIGVLATEDNPLNAKPSHIVMVADTLGSFGDVYSHPRLHKLFAFPETEIYAAASGNIDQASFLITLINNQIASIPAATRNHGDIVRAMAQATFMFRLEKFNLTVLPKYGVPPSTAAPHTKIGPNYLLEAKALVSEGVQAEIQEEWKNFSLGCDLIVGALNYQGQAALFSLYDTDPIISFATFPGFWAIGSGEDNAKFWLSHRRHILKAFS